MSGPAPVKAPDVPHPVSRPVFLARATYRQRRMRDAAALLPILGALLFALPLLWIGQNGGGARTSYVMIYVFTVWAGLVILSAAITRILGIGAAANSASDDEGAADMRRG